MLLRWIVSLEQGAWDDKVATYQTLCELDTELLELSADSMRLWTGNSMSSIVFRTLTVHKPTFMVRLMAWRVRWLPHQRWADVSNERLLEAHKDSSTPAPCQDCDAGFINTEASVLPVGQVVPPNLAHERGVVVIDHEQQSLW